LSSMSEKCRETCKVEIWLRKVLQSPPWDNQSPLAMYGVYR